MKEIKRLLSFTSLLLLLFAGKINATQIYSCCHGEHHDMTRITYSANLKNEKTLSFGVGDFLVLHVENLDSLLAHQKDGLYLWINGICYPNVPVKYIDRSCNRLFFDLNRDTARSSPWKVMYTYNYYLTTSKLAAVSVGTTTTRLTGCWPIAIRTSEKWMVALGWLMIIGLVVLTFFLAKRLLRDTLPLMHVANYKVLYTRKKGVPPGENEIYFEDIPYSLSRAQLLFWNIVVILSIIYVWMYTDELVSPTATVLTVIGISGGTNLIGRIIDRNQTGEKAKALKEVRAEGDAPVVTDVAGAAAAAADPETITVKDFYNEGYCSKGFFRDLLSDGGSISIHRFQLVVFTLIIGIYFMWQVIYNLAMPQFSETMLILMGISSTTYAGVKITEK